MSFWESRAISFRVLSFLVIAIIGILKLTILSTPAPELEPSKCLNSPLPTGCGFIFDEAHYVPATRKLLAGQNVNAEHPPLTKVLIATSMMLFGDNPLGWRVLIALSSLLGLVLLNRIAQNITRSERIAFFATLFFSTDIMSFNLGSIAMLDAPALTLALGSALLFLRGKYMLSSLLMGLAFLAKLTSVFVAVSLLAYLFILIFSRRRRLLDSVNEWMPTFEKMFFVGLGVTVIGLGLYDVYFKAFSTPFEHLDYMLSYHGSLRFSQNDKVDFPLSWINPAAPFQPAPYYSTIVTSSDGRQTHPVYYLGIYSPLWWMSWIIVPSAIYGAVTKYRRQEDYSAELFILTWILANYLPYFFFAHLLNRWVYTFYFYMTLPLLAVGAALFLSNSGLSRIVLYLLVIVQVAWFFIWFPVRGQEHINLLLSLGLPA